MKRIILSAAALLLTGNMTAQAQEFAPYTGIGLGVYGIEASDPGFTQSTTVVGGFVKVGVDFNDLIAAELRVGKTGKDKKTFAAGTTIGGVTYVTPAVVELSADFMASYLLKFKYDFTDTFRAHAVIGGTTAKFKQTVTSAALSSSISNTQSGLTYGVGGELKINENFSAEIEWAQYWTGISINAMTNAKLWGITATLDYHY